MIYIKSVDFYSEKELFEYMMKHSKDVHSEYESVKFYGKSDLIMNMLKYIIRNYDDVVIASTDIILSSIDPIAIDLYVMSLTEDNEIFIEPAYSNNVLLRNEAKFTICDSNIDYDVICEHIYIEPIVIANIKF